MHKQSGVLYTAAGVATVIVPIIVPSLLQLKAGLTKTLDCGAGALH